MPLEAKDFQFSPSTLQVPADRSFTLVFTNSDAAIPHNVVISIAEGATVFSGAIFNGVGTMAYAVPSLAPSAYSFACIVHPTMTGTLSAS